MWGIHPGLAIRPGARIQAPAAEAVFAEGHAEPGSSLARASPGRTCPCPTAGPWTFRSPGPPIRPAGAAYLTALSGGWLAVTDVESRSGFALTFDPAVLPVVWLWGVYGGWRGVYAVALEAWTSYPARLDQAIAAGRHRTLEPGAEFETEVRLIAFTGIASVGGVDLDGRVLEG